MNFISALFCYLGLFIGLGINGIDDQANEFLLMVAAAAFIYVTSMHILPEMELEEDKFLNLDDQFEGQRFVKKLGIALIFGGFGWTMMYILAVFEGDLQQAFA